jgi:hypothetical protein
MIDRLAPVNKIELCTDACIRNLWSLVNLVASTVAELDDTPLYFMDDIGIVFRSPTDYPVRFSCEDGTRVQWVRLDSLIVNTKGGHS